MFEHLIASINVVHNSSKTATDEAAFPGGKLFGANPADLATSYAYQIPKLMSDVALGRYYFTEHRVSYNSSEENTAITPKGIKISYLLGLRCAQNPAHQIDSVRL